MFIRILLLSEVCLKYTKFTEGRLEGSQTDRRTPGNSWKLNFLRGNFIYNSFDKRLTPQRIEQISIIYLMRHVTMTGQYFSFDAQCTYIRTRTH